MKMEINYVFSNIDAINPFTEERIPVIFTNYVLMDYGTGAIFGCLT